MVHLEGFHDDFMRKMGEHGDLIVISWEFTRLYTPKVISGSSP